MASLTQLINTLYEYNFDKLDKGCVILKPLFGGLYDKVYIEICKEDTLGIIGNIFNYDGIYYNGFIVNDLNKKLKSLYDEWENNLSYSDLKNIQK